MKEFVCIAVFLAAVGMFAYMIIGAVQNIFSKDKKIIRAAAMVAEINDAEAYKALFDTKDGQRLEFSITKSEFDELNVGDVGTLAYRGKVYLGFVPDTLSKGDNI